MMWNELLEAKAQVEKGVVPKDLPELLENAANYMKYLSEFKHVKLRFEDETLTLQELLDRYREAKEKLNLLHRSTDFPIPPMVS